MLYIVITARVIMMSKNTCITYIGGLMDLSLIYINLSPVRLAQF